MQNQTPTYTTAIKAEYRLSDYAEEDVSRIYSALDSFGSVRAHGLPIPAAGGSAEIWLVIEFIGLNAATGLLQHFGVKFYDRLAEALLGLTKNKLKRVSVPAQIETIVLSYDDLDISISLPKRRMIKDLPKTISNIHKHLNSSPLSDRSPKYIYAPLIYSDGYWRTILGWETSKFSFRYWGISDDRRVGFTSIYDSHNRKILDPSYGKTASFLYSEIARLKQTFDDKKIRDYVNRIQGLSIALGIPIEHDGKSIGSMLQNLLDICDQVDLLDFQSRIEAV